MAHRCIIRMFAAFLAVLLSSTLSAAPVSINDLPTETTGGFKHNNFHDATLLDGTDGAKLAWFDLGAGGGSYDGMSGAFIVNIDLYLEDTLTTPIGTALGTGNLVLAEFNGWDGGLIGTISWDFDVTAEANGLTDTTMSFIDIAYATSTAGYIPNSAGLTAAGDVAISLWGADGDLDLTTGRYEGVGAPPSLGVDFVATFVPVPAAVWLFGSGLLAMIGVARARRQIR